MSDNHKSQNAENWIPETRSRLAQRRAKKPDTKAGQIWALWPEIKAALESGQSVRTIQAWLEEDAGIVVGVTSLTSYISRSRRREKDTREAEKETAPANRTDRSAAVKWMSRSAPPHKSILEPSPQSLDANDSRTLPGDPIAQAMQALRKPRINIKKIHGDGDPTNKNLI